MVTFCLHLGKVLPGQRDGSQQWYDSVTSFTRRKLNFESCAAYPCLLRAADAICILLLHVDDMQIVCEEPFFFQNLIPTFESTYKISVSVMKDVGDEINFLKRTHVLVEDNVIHIQQNRRHFDKLFEVVGVSSKLKAKKTPWLFAADSDFEADLTKIEDHVETSIDMDLEEEEAQERSRQLHSVFTGLLRGRSLNILRSVPGRNGFEVFRQLTKLYTPNTRPRSMAILTAIMNLPAFGKERTLYDHVQGLDRLISEYQKSCGQAVPEEVCLSVLVRCLPGHIRQHIQLSLDQTSKYSDIRNKVLGFESVTTNWSSTRIHNEFGIGGSANNTNMNSSSSTGIVPMDVDLVQSLNQIKGKGKSKGKGKGKYDQQPKGKGKNKGKGKDKGKGKQQYSYNQQNSQGDQRVSNNNCLYCGKPGHWKRDCRKLAHDKQTGQIRQVDDQTVHSPPPSVSSATTYSNPGSSHVSFATGASTSSNQPVGQFQQVGKQQTGQVRRVEFAPMWNDFHETPDEFDNPDDEEFVQLYNIRALTAETVSLDPDACETDGAYKCAVFDMTCTDSDCSWTMAPDLLNHVRAFEHVGGDMDIILDSGADGSALPLCFGEVGRAVRPGQHVVYVDAQGDPLNIANTRKATVDCGDTSLEEEFLIASVTSPLLSLGRLMKQGWIINTDDAGPHLWNGTSRIPITFKRNSLCIKGMIRMVEQSDEPPMDEMQVRAITLSENLSAVKTSWKKLGEACFAIRTYKPFFVDTTMAPAELFLWYRTTLVKEIQHGMSLNTISLFQILQIR